MRNQKRTTQMKDSKSNDLNKSTAKSGSRQPTKEVKAGPRQPTKEVKKKEKKTDFQFPELEEIQQGFDDFDVEGKGTISSKEFVNIMEEMKLDEKYPYLYSVFKKINKEISYDELIEILNNSMEEINKKENLKKLYDFLLEEEGAGNKLPWHTFIKMAKELNESKTEEELRQLLSASGCLGGEIDFDEFCKVMEEGGLDK